MCIYCTFTAARLAAFLYKSVTSDRIKAALPLIALTKWVCGGLVCLQLEPFAGIGLRPRIPP